jgi:SNF2 family DNA or RNA helicase
LYKFINCSNKYARHIKPGQARLVVYHGPGRQNMQAELESTDIVLTTYETLRADWLANRALYSKYWYRIVLDEGTHNDPFF